MPTTYKTPFFHMEFPNFLTHQQLTKLDKIYQKLQFREKTSDLFHFFQTNQLAAETSLEFFKKNLSKQFAKLCTPEQFKKSFYTTFASYYFKGDYLLCHDDIIQDRKYAFSFYLQDFKSGGQLVLLNDKANKQVKKIQPKKNTLVIFQVCDQSYHQVALCTQNGRKAVTGWFNVKGQGSKRVQKSLDSFKPNLIKQIIAFPLEQNYVEQQYFQLMDVQYQFNIKKQTLQGPFYSRRIHRIQIDPAVVFQIPGYSVVSTDFYKFKQGDYLLLNDPMNQLENNQQIIDIFVTNLSEGFQVDQGNMLVKIIQEDGSLSGIPEIHDSLFVVHRGKKQYYIERNQKEFILAHFIYKKKNANDKKNTKIPSIKTDSKKQTKFTNNKSKKVEKKPQNNKKTSKVTKGRKSAKITIKTTKNSKNAKIQEKPKVKYNKINKAAITIKPKGKGKASKKISKRNNSKVTKTTKKSNKK